MRSFGIARMWAEPERLPQRQSWVGKLRYRGALLTVTLTLPAKRRSPWFAHISRRNLLSLGGAGTTVYRKAQDARRSVRLTPGAGLIALLLSLGLWAAIWLAVSSLASAWPS
jgi:hypothetical protein